MKPTMGELFAGIGGFSLGFERAGFDVAWQGEIEPFCRRVLAKNFPKAERYNDVRESGSHNLKPVDVICGGFPCQDISYAGKQAGISGARSGLWSEYARIISELRPKFIVVENVSALLNAGMGRVVGDLAAIGYDAEWDCIPACAFGAPHRRDRLWIVAYPMRERLEGVRCSIGIPKEQLIAAFPVASRNAQGVKRLYGIQQRDSRPEHLGADYRLEWGGKQWPETEPLLYRVDDGVRYGARRITALGNAVVPQIPEWIANRIKPHLVTA